ncbi:MAG: tetratricopeptide repeat protein, partial [candidate division NC10 bacterium]
MDTLTIDLQTSPEPPDAGPRANREARVEAMPVGSWTVVLVLLLAAATYLNSLTYDFVWDDTLMLLGGPKLRDLRNLPQFFLSDFTTLTSGALEGHYYRPTLALTLALDATFWGLQPALFHLTNILLHVGVTFLVNRLALAMGARRDIALLAALLFAVHPAHVEVVAFVAARVDLLLSIGVLGCLLAYRRSDAPGCGRIAWGGAALAMQAFALLSKETAVTLPALLVLSDLLHSPASDQPAERTTLRHALMRSLPFWIVTVAFATFRFSQLLSIAGDRLQGSGFWQRLPGSFELLARYVILSLVPTHMQPFYSLKRPESFLSLWPALGLLLGGGLVALLIWSWRRAPLAAFATAWFLITISPVVDLVPLSPREMGMADRYLYLPSVGVPILLAMGFAALLRPTDGQWRSFRRPIAWGALALLLIAYPWQSFRYAPVWRNDLTLYTRMTEVAPHAPIPYLNLGLTYFRANDLPRATAALEQAFRLNPTLPRPRTILALVYVLQGRARDGFQLFDGLASEGARDRDYSVSRLMAHLVVGEPREAVAIGEEGIGRFSEDADLGLWLGRALDRAGRPSEAMERYHRVLELRPDLYEAEEALGSLLARSGRGGEAAQHFLRSAEVRPDRTQPFRALAMLAEERGDR